MNGDYFPRLIDALRRRPVMVVMILLAAAAVTFGLSRGGDKVVESASPFAQGTPKLSDPSPVTDPYLGLPMMVKSYSIADPIYRPQRTGMEIEYVGNVVNTDMPDNLFDAVQNPRGGAPALRALHAPLKAGDRLIILDDLVHDPMVGLSFVRVRRTGDDKEGLIPLDTLSAETVAVDQPYRGYGWVVNDGWTWGWRPVNLQNMSAVLEAMRVGDYKTAFKSSQAHEVNPTVASAYLIGFLLTAMDESQTDQARQELLQLAETYFEKWVIPEAIEFSNGGISWPYLYEFKVHWRMKMTPPWFSGFGNGQFAFAASLLYRLTGKDTYRDLAKRAVRWLQLPVSEGGGGYKMGDYVFLAEYSIPSPPKPNIRVLDGEFKGAMGVFNAAIALQDDHMLRYATKLIFSLAARMANWTTNDCYVMNARYPWILDNESYVQFMRWGAMALGQITKDQRMFDLMKCWRRAESVW